MALRTDAQAERIATLRSVMNVIALLDAEPPRRSALSEAVDLRALLPWPLATETNDDDPWSKVMAHPITIRSAQ